MARYVDADLIEYKAICVPMLDGVLVRTKQLDGFYAIKKDIEAIPTADVQEVIHAKFELVNNGKGVCSNCHRLDSIDDIAKYCRYCGARMDGDEK